MRGVGDVIRFAVCRRSLTACDVGFGLRPVHVADRLYRMPDTPPLIVFTDLDGTLIDHVSYRWDAAAPALQALKDIGAGVVLASSKTAPEIVTLRAAMGLAHWPAIVENGAGLLDPHSDAIPDAGAYLRLRAVLDGLPPALRTHFRGFGDMTTGDIASATGLTTKAAAQAATRAWSEPGLWTGTPAQMTDFLNALADHNVSAREGGRFLTLSFGTTKADQMAKITARYRPAMTVALGDAPNDVEMLEAADRGVIVANPHRDPLPELDGETSGRIKRTGRAGPEGWNMAVLRLLSEIRNTQDTPHG